MVLDVERLGFAALLHDVGKLVQFAEKVPESYRKNNMDLYQPKWNGHPTHSHALYTAYFIEKFQEYFPEKLCKGKGYDDSFINLAAMHHKPESPLQWIIAEADRLSSGIDREEFPEGKSIPPSDAVKTRLIPPFDVLFKDIKAGNFNWRYRLEPLSVMSIFPEKNTSNATEKDYIELYNKLKDGLKELKHRENPVLWLQHFDSLYRIVTSHIPSARVGRVIPDVSLYDHSRSTAALAVALYKWHREMGNLNDIDEIKNRKEKKFLLLSGDFYGIQNFIFSSGGEQRGRRSKILRGRSFVISLLTELAACELCIELGLSFLSVVICAGGKFHIIAHNTENSRNKIDEVSARINDWLIDVSFGENSIGISATELSPEEFLDGRFRDIWNKHVENMDEKKFKRFDIAKHGGVKSSFLDSFRNDLHRPLCPFCAKRPSEQEVENDPLLSGPNERASACRLCRDQILIGTKLVKNNYITLLESTNGDLEKPLFGRYQVKFSRDLDRLNIKDAVKLWAINTEENGSLPVDVTFMPLNGYVPVYGKEDEKDERILAGARSEDKKLELIDMIRSGDPMTFAHIASKALKLDGGRFYGIDVLGVLKADVDNLGAIFSCGFTGNMFTLSRLATLSRALNNFFAIYLPYALKHEANGKFRNIYTVFAGGDDLFLIGPWNVILDVVGFIRKKFGEYTCNREEIHISAGITLHKPYVPVDIIAEKAEESLEASKSVDGKDAVTIFNRTVKWSDFDELMSEVYTAMKNWMNDDCISTAFLHRLNSFADMAERELYYLNSAAGRTIKDIECFKWRAFLCYQVFRNVASGLGIDRARQEEIRRNTAIKLAGWLEKFRGTFIIPLWTILYEHRIRKS
ncbi:type III-A CRISPR-associated protein Cas10/Csm1 [Thermodesulforhabdus norvegica]|uniref:CRISPR system single-strand-specific deoxyribonuclease Cas10/Csm1 (subtype III-A) n=1 Tax=Thermodesulforhabdus norvegica TaxID=39841 RepID=A0A1I4S838_9BACT|nr:type III-A CRISPR-associated protein Cas10/Csm1 [Thermodesulforhabdus norvegica]SFM60464.1 CRISPR-associated protein Csm1 [Thermodesulforhabdus norvegica]